tara:strand:- start:12 stop:878 length:867 start_codon:yes stop_codon:yes gene_type:complete
MTNTKYDSVSLMKVSDFIGLLYGDSGARDWSEMRRFANLTALRNHPDHGYFVSNFWRGPLLYSLVRKLHPKIIVELGTGRGYGAVAMAAAVRDEAYEAQIHTIDLTPETSEFEWIYADENGIETSRSTSLCSFWGKELPAELTNRISFHCADTATVHSILEQESLEADLVFIDGDHSYFGVALDFYSSHSRSAEGAVFVFDDYSDRSGYGVKRLIDGQLSDLYEIQPLDMESDAAYDVEMDHRMAVVNPRGYSVDVSFPKPGSLRFSVLDLRRNIRSILVNIVRRVRS